MKVVALRVQHFRTHEQYSATFDSDITLIGGPNGSGKTSLIEAIYVALRGKSFKGTDVTIVRRGQDWYRVDIETTLGKRKIVYDARSVNKKKTYTIDDKQSARLPAKAKYPVVLFEPEDLRITNGSPTRRRHFIDTMIAQCDEHYGAVLRKYERAIVQRNKLLKGGYADADTLFPWDVLLSQCGATIITTRQAVIDELNAQLTEIYQTIANTTDSVSIAYSYSRHVTPNQLFTEYTAQHDRDRMLGSTSTGPHRHDVLISFNERPASDVCSRGENRTIVLALKFLEAAYIEAHTGNKPIILLDDVFSELDDNRQRQLMKEFENNQIIMTSVGTGVAVGIPVILLEVR